MDTNKATVQSKETSEKMSSAIVEAASFIQSGCTTAFEGVQAYNNKLVEFTQANATAAFDFVQKLYGIKSPSAFIDLSTEHARKQTEVLTDQTEQLRALVQNIALGSTESLESGAAKAASHTA
jgi:hypothetical protein